MKEPISSRDVLYDTLRDGSLVFLDWCIVDTPVGAMLEPRQILPPTERVVNVNMFDMSFSRLTPFKEDLLFSMFMTSGRQLPVDYNPY